MLDAHKILLYCNTDVVIARICLASLKTARRLIAFGFHKEKEVCQHLHSSDPVIQFWFAQYAQYIGMLK